VLSIEHSGARLWLVTLEEFMALHLRFWGLCACVLIAMAASRSVTYAAASDTAPANPSQTIFVDLTGSGSAQATAPSVPSTPPVTETTFIDLSKGNGSNTIMERRTPDRIRTPRTRQIDLSNGALLPPALQGDDAYIPEPDTVTITADRIGDPYEEGNRGRFRTHVGLHRYVIDPVERTYIAVVPSPARSGLHNFLTNLETPTVLANDLLQGDLDRAGNTLSRFVVNTTIGIGGIFDFAGDAGIAYRDNDFGATLASYGVSDSPYLLVPIIGPSNPRDLGGKVVDFALDPLHFVTLPGGIITSIGHTGLHEVDKRSVDVGDLDMLAKTSPDAYAEERAKARAERDAEINGTPPTPPPWQ
jgi:phospholipid-binding lipoprotein MlaA